LLISVGGGGGVGGVGGGDKMGAYGEDGYWEIYRDCRGADKSLARPGRKQATATKL